MLGHRIASEAESHKGRHHATDQLGNFKCRMVSDRCHPKMFYVYYSVHYRKRRGSYSRIYHFLTHSELLYYRVCLDENFPMGPCSTSEDENLLR
jgi:hypothetical protein